MVATAGGGPVIAVVIIAAVAFAVGLYLIAYAIFRP